MGDAYPLNAGWTRFVFDDGDIERLLQHLDHFSPQPVGQGISQNGSPMSKAMQKSSLAALASAYPSASITIAMSRAPSFCSWPGLP